MIKKCLRCMMMPTNKETDEAEVEYLTYLG